MLNPRFQEIKREKKKSLFLREIAALVQSLGGEDQTIAKVYVTRVDLSADTGICYVYFSTYGEFSEELFKDVLERLKLYKPSMRKAIARSIPGRYTPDLLFLYDKPKEKEFRINQLLDKASAELREAENQDGEINDPNTDQS